MNFISLMKQKKLKAYHKKVLKWITIVIMVAMVVTMAIVVVNVAMVVIMAMVVAEHII